MWNIPFLLSIKAARQNLYSSRWRKHERNMKDNTETLQEEHNICAANYLKRKLTTVPHGTCIHRNSLHCITFCVILRMYGQYERSYTKHQAIRWTTWNCAQVLEDIKLPHVFHRCLCACCSTKITTINCIAKKKYYKNNTNSSITKAQATASLCILLDLSIFEEFSEKDGESKADNLFCWLIFKFNRLNTCI